MTLEEYQERLRNLASVAAQSAAEQIIIPNANELLAKIKNRIQIDGKNSSGSDIGRYSKKPAYYSRDQFDKKSSFKPIGKTGKRTKSTMYVSDGYYGLRGLQGKPNDKINETYTGSTMASYQLEPIEKGAVIGFLNKQSSDIRKGQEKKRGPIFSATDEEMREYSEQVAKDTAEITLKILNA